MPVPSEYQRATDDFYKFLIKVRDLAGFGSTHQAYTMVQGVLLTFRRRLEIKDAISFAAALRQCIDEKAFDQVLSKLPDGAIEFWQP
ncbi:MAG: DUF2267 domain-containing protein [Chlorobiaceae bacterium]|nr:DUF2267 domain-containing protein [Chlorobiaceae bacterium]